MKITKICNILRSELYGNGYEYGFYSGGKRYKPDISNGFDSEYYNLSKSIYRIQSPTETMKEKIGTCIDAVLVMDAILKKNSLSSKIWLLYNDAKTKYHTVLTFEAENKPIYLELTPQSSKPYYGKEKIYDCQSDFISEFQNNGWSIFEITNKIIIGSSPDYLLDLPNK